MKLVQENSIYMEKVHIPKTIKEEPDTRSHRLLTETLVNLMMISLHGESNNEWCQKDVNTYISYWHNNFNVKLPSE